MERHHVYVLLGLLLAISGSYVAYLFPHLAGLHNAGMGLAIQGFFDWYYSCKENKRKARSL